MAQDPALIIELPAGSTLEQSLRRDPPRWFGEDQVAVVGIEADEEGRLESPATGRVVMSVPSPEALSREPDEVRRVIHGVPPGSEPVVVVVEEAEELRQDELSAVLEAGRHARRNVILRVIDASP